MKEGRVLTLINLNGTYIKDIHSVYYFISEKLFDNLDEK